ncbi:hypothetical protein, partial [Pseudonocardia sp. KRD291]|uniref:hypothetical protein n=1 Tax=Pseudonocardia sp. KRD291 TaxID=2792007 RepID=UPI001C4A01BD
MTVLGSGLLFALLPLALLAFAYFLPLPMLVVPAAAAAAAVVYVTMRTRRTDGGSGVCLRARNMLTSSA